MQHIRVVLILKNHHDIQHQKAYQMKGLLYKPQALNNQKLDGNILPDAVIIKQSL